MSGQNNLFIIPVEFPIKSIKDTRTHDLINIPLQLRLRMIGTNTLKDINKDQLCICKKGFVQNPNIYKSTVLTVKDYFFPSLLLKLLALILFGDSPPARYVSTTHCLFCLCGWDQEQNAAGGRDHCAQFSERRAKAHLAFTLNDKKVQLPNYQLLKRISLIIIPSGKNKNKMED